MNRPLSKVSSQIETLAGAGEPTVLFTTSHMLLYISVDNNMLFQHSPSPHDTSGVLFFSKYFTLEKLKSLLGAV